MVAGFCGVDIYHDVVPNWFINVSVRLSMVAGCCGVDIYHDVVPNWFINVSVKTVYGCRLLRCGHIP